MVHRFFVPKEQISNTDISIIGSDASQIKNVLKLEPGEEIDILDGSGRIYASKIKTIGQGKVICEIVSSRAAKSEPKIKTTLIQSIPREAKMDFIIQKSTELGVADIIPVSSERTIVKLDDKKREVRLERWQRITKEAAEQSGRGIVPRISPLKELIAALKEANDLDLKLIPWEMEENTSIKDLFEIEKNPKGITIAIGPEGGFSANEVKAAIKYGFTPVTLGKRILRAETAGIAVLSMVNYEFEL